MSAAPVAACGTRSWPCQGAERAGAIVAAECLAMSKTAGEFGNKMALLNMAVAWTELAEHGEESAKRRRVRATVEVNPPQSRCSALPHLTRAPASLSRE